MIPNILPRIGLIITAFVISMSSAFPQEMKITEKRVPPAVIAAFKAAYPTASILGYSREREDGKVYYEIESKSSDGEQTVDVLYNPDGTVAEIEESIDIALLPPAAQEALRTTYAKATVKTVERSTRDNVVTYEVHARVRRKMRELKFDADGKPIK